MAVIVTGRRGEPHITSNNDRARNIEAFGKGKFLLDVGHHLWATLQGNAVTIQDGMCMSHGTQMGINPLSSDVVYIENGSAGQKRNDLICMRYTKDTSLDIESAEIVVIKGEMHPSAPVDPDYTDGDIYNGAILDDTPLWRAKLDGTQITLEPVIKFRSGSTPTGADAPDPESPTDPTNKPAPITEPIIDELWGSGIEDGDAQGW